MSVLIGIVIGIFIAGFFFVQMNPCRHENTEYVTKCIGCGKVFNDGLSELRKRL